MAEMNQEYIRIKRLRAFRKPKAVEKTGDVVNVVFMVVFLRTWYVSLHWEIVSSHKRYSLNLYDFHSSEQMLWRFSYYFVFHWRKSYRFGITRGWVNDSFFEWTIPLKLILSDSYSSTELFHSKSARWRLKFKLCAICYKWWHISFLICFICYYYYDFFSSDMRLKPCLAQMPSVQNEHVFMAKILLGNYRVNVYLEFKCTTEQWTSQIETDRENEVS